MFYKLIEQKRNLWLEDKLCPVTELLKYILQRGKLRDAQVDRRTKKTDWPMSCAI